MIGLLPSPILLFVLAGNGLLRGWLLLLWVLFLGAFGWLATILPGSLYFLLQRLQFYQIRQQFVEDARRLDPKLTSDYEAEQKHKTQLSTALPEGLDPRGLLQIYGSALVIAAGWTTVLHQVPVEFVDGAQPLFRPIPDPITFGFLGGYFFALNSTLRRYFQSDLSPRAYTGIVSRLVLTLLLAWVLTGVASELPGSPGLGLIAALTFIVGIVPEAGVAVLTDLVRAGLRLPALVLNLGESHPLTSLQGVSYYDSARFSEEGIYSVDNLVHANLYNLMLRTRVGTDRLVDLVDQAILYLHARRDLRFLGHLGIRTATDLRIGLPQTRCVGELHHEQGAESADEGDQLLDVLQRLDVVAAVVAEERWMQEIQNWRRGSVVGSSATART